MLIYLKTCHLSTCLVGFLAGLGLFMLIVPKRSRGCNSEMEPIPRLYVQSSMHFSNTRKLADCLLTGEAGNPSHICSHPIM